MFLILMPLSISQLIGKLLLQFHVLFIFIWMPSLLSHPMSTNIWSILHISNIIFSVSEFIPFFVEFVLLNLSFLCRSLLVLLAIVLHVFLLFTASDYPFGTSSFSFETNKSSLHLNKCMCVEWTLKYSVF
jgi:hypothetical protein